jgi:hypothetical protein
MAMTLKRPKGTRVQVLVRELDGQGKVLPGSAESISVWNSSADDVRRIVRAALETAVAEEGGERGAAK